MISPKIIFFGNGPLAEYALAELKKCCTIIFHARTKEDLEEVKRLKNEQPDAFGVLASFGVMLKNDILELFEPVGILNIHPSDLPKYRGSSPIETAILNGETKFTVSIMKIVSAMDAGPIYHKESFSFANDTPKDEIYQKLATAGAKYLCQALSSSNQSSSLPKPVPQSGEPTFTSKFDKSMSKLDPKHKTAAELANEIRAFAGFPKSKFDFYGLDCTIIAAHPAAKSENTAIASRDTRALYIQCKDNSYLIIDKIQPAGRKIMDAKSFINGYAKK